MTQYTFSEELLSDLYKDVFGSRPSQDYYRAWDAWTDNERQEEWDWLVRALDQEIEREKVREAEAILEFEARVDMALRMGAKDRAAALRWIMQGSEADGDWGYFCYLNGLPYNYFAAQQA